MLHACRQYASVSAVCVFCGFWVFCGFIGLIVSAAQASESAAPAIFRDCATCPKMVIVPAGRAEIGSSPSALRTIPPGTPADVLAAEQPAHMRIISKAFAIGRTEITRDEYARFADATAVPDGNQCFVWNSAERAWENRKGVSWRDPGFAQKPNHPVVCVSWPEANAYAAWLSRVTGQPYRLLSEAEWEYAARAGSSTPRHWGPKSNDACQNANVNDLSRAALDTALSRAPAAAFQCYDGYPFTAPVGSFPPSPFGLFDMIGNVWEWTADCFNPTYAGAPEDGGAWLSGDCSQRINRGGSWADPPWRTRTSVREWDPLHGRYAIHGFRVARDL